MKKTILALLAVGATALSRSVYADTIAFFGSASASGNSSTSSPTTVSFGTNWTVVATSGALFAGVANGQAPNMHSFQFSGEGQGASCIGCPLVQWDFNNGTQYQFTLNSLINAATRPGSIA